MLLTRLSGLGDPGGGGASQVEWWYPPEAGKASASQREEAYVALVEWNSSRDLETGLYARYNALSDEQKRSDSGARAAAALSRARLADNRVLEVFQPKVREAYDRGYIDASSRLRVTPPSSFAYPKTGSMSGIGAWPTGLLVIVLWICAALAVALLAQWAREYNGRIRDAERYIANAELMKYGYAPEPAPSGDPITGVLKEGTNIAGLAVIGIGLFVLAKLIPQRRAG